MAFEKIIPDLYVLYGEISSNTYLLNQETPILIDPGMHRRENLLKGLNDLHVKKEQIKTILLTHSHFDHFINCGLFPSAIVLCSESAKRDLDYKYLLSGHGKIYVASEKEQRENIRQQILKLHNL